MKRNLKGEQISAQLQSHGFEYFSSIYMGDFHLTELGNQSDHS